MNSVLHNGIDLLKLDNPPINSVGHKLGRPIVEGLERANADPAIEALMLIGSRAGFSGDADIREFDSCASDPAHRV
jgi:3-hydroxyacyl-CoA dehydrogenase